MQLPAQGHNNGELSHPNTLLPGLAGHRRKALTADPGSIVAARDFTAATLHRWCLDALIWDAVMVASELVTNAIRHGTRQVGASEWAASPDPTPPQVGLAWSRQANRVVCVVTDCSTNPPLMVAAGPYDESGRGLKIVQSVATAWGWALLSSKEKAVWAAFRLPAAKTPV